MPSADPNIDRTENLRPYQPLRLSRSPHPYQRNHATILQDNYTNVPTRSLAISSTRERLSSSLNSTDSKAEYFDADQQGRQRGSTSPSDSGTEADDEKEAAAVGLLAPPVRPRKGFIGSNESETASPLLTPSYLDEEARHSAWKHQLQPGLRFQIETCTGEDAVKRKEKFNRRRRAELVRRISEVILLGFVGFIACKNDIEWYIRSHHPSKASTNVAARALKDTAPTLSVWGSVVLSLYISYPIRIIFNNHALSVARKRSPFYIHLPAAFDPAPLLYPVLIPVLVAVSLIRRVEAILIPNLILSIAAIPSKVVPLNADLPWFSSPQWLFAIMPMVISPQWCGSGSEYCDLANPAQTVLGKDKEWLLFLYPLHQALLPALEYLTTTSLLPAELQLLSISMINLLTYAVSPQAVILKSLLWIGGLSVYVLCRKILTWEVALARIPRWRFQQASRPLVRNDNVIWRAIDHSLGGRLTRCGMISNMLANSEDSDNDVSGGPANTATRKNHERRVSVGTYRGEAATKGPLYQLPNAPTLKDSPLQSGGELAANGRYKELGPALGHRRQRDATLPSQSRTFPEEPSGGFVRRRSRSHLQALRLFSPRSLSKTQAIILSWVFALYTYVIVFLVIASIVRKYISHEALQGHEPVGWALGYLLGDLSILRFYRVNLNLQNWIPLPLDVPPQSLPLLYGWLGLQQNLGAPIIRLMISGYCLVIIFAGLAVVFRLSAIAEVDTRRKVFHGMMVAMFLPTIFIDPTFVALAFALILSAFLLLDLFRASQLPPLSKPLTFFLAPYVDGRDHRGPVIVSHIFLLIGCAIPLWLSIAASEQTGQGPWQGWEVKNREISMISGIVCVGMGDAAASLIGRRFGRRRWCWSGGKSLEGSFAFAVSVVLGLCLARLWLLSGGWEGDSGDSWATTIWKASIAAIGSSLTEAVLTGGNDNVIVPVVLWLLVRGLKI